MIETGQAALVAFLFTLILVPVFRKIASKTGLLDKPNLRKIHHEPTPLIGGLVVALAACISLLICPSFPTLLQSHAVVPGATIIILIIGILDDRLDVKPLYRLLVEMACAYALAASGVRITSFYGVLGLETLPEFWQYVLTIVVVSGVVNAFNLMDGIDGLAGGLALSGFLAFTALSFFLGLYPMAVLLSAMAGALIGFLKFNLSKKKIFLGDGGSLMLGFLLVGSGIYLLESAQKMQASTGPVAILVVIGIFLLPVLDSLRVYRGRIKNGKSPFLADRSHIHHLFLYLGFSHRKTSMAINLIHILILSVLLVFYSSMSITLLLLLTTGLFLGIASVLALNHQVMVWSNKIREMENK